MTFDSPLKAKRHIAQITKGAQRAAELTQQILTFSHRTEYKKRPLKLYLVVKEALKLLRSSIPVTIEISEKIISREKILADPTQMLQVIINLCTNAYHAMEEKGGCLTVHLTDGVMPEQRDFFGQKKTPGKYVTLLIEDNGHGMEEEIMSKAFDPYFSTKPVGKGTGFGLALVSAIVEEHEGYIKAESTPGIGTSFYIFLPAVDDEMLPNETESFEALPMEGVGNIMVVDDEINIRQIIQQYLTNFGYQVTIFENAFEALEAFEFDPDRFDLMITDMTMPGMTGSELSEKVLVLRPDFPIILCTGYSESITEGKAYEMGINQYLLKPVDNRKLVQMVREILLADPEKRALLNRNLIDH
jgi:CheY-like chemotaxis protein/two-component sensor histidine kinase